jgi:DNA-binding MarR family transcriptional regulator
MQIDEPGGNCQREGGERMVLGHRSRGHRDGHRDVRRAFDALRRIVQVLRASATAAHQTVGLTGAQIFVLRQLGASPRMSMNDLAARTFTHQSTVSMVVRRLRTRKLVEKTPAAGDRRRVELTLTRRGRALLRRASPTPQERLADAIVMLPTRQRTVLASALTSVAAALSASRGRPPMLFQDVDGK